MNSSRSLEVNSYTGRFKPGRLRVYRNGNKQTWGLSDEDWFAPNALTAWVQSTHPTCWPRSATRPSAWACACWTDRAAASFGLRDSLLDVRSSSFLSRRVAKHSRGGSAAPRTLTRRSTTAMMQT